MLLRKNVIIISIFIFLITSVSFGQTQITWVKENKNIIKMQSKYHSLNPFVGLTLQGGISYTLADFEKYIPGPAFQGSLEFYFPSQMFFVFGLKGSFGYEQLKGETANSYLVGNKGLSINSFKTDVYHLEGMLVLASGVNNFIVHGGIGAGYVLKYSPKNSAGTELYSPAQRDGFLGFVLEGGMRYFVSSQVSLDGTAKYHIGKVDDFDGRIYSTKDSYYTIMGGLTIHFFASSRIK